MSLCSNRIKEVRKRFKETQKEFADNINISQAHLSNIENGKDNPSDKLLRVISAEYEISFDWLKTGEGEMTIGMDCPEIKEVLSSLKTFLSNCGEIEYLLSTDTLMKLPKFLSWNNRDGSTGAELWILQVDLLDTLFQYKSYLETETHNIGASGDSRKKIDELFDIKKLYEEKILDSLDRLFNILIGTGK